MIERRARAHALEFLYSNGHFLNANIIGKVRDDVAGHGHSSHHCNVHFVPATKRDGA